ncbi:MAG: hypothetical protein UX50_C0013G0005 [Candidatus Beckwithbacteria bacterium GW2011_GWA1_46_30]|nr:MAG: hypothetical protein UX50_C0013G0005 [Candidatus Beckwithbacteria bacterium GW2011_GWA1_46_30]
MPSATGIRGTGNLGVNRKYDVADVVSLLDVNRYPLLAILTNAGKDPASGEGKALKKQEAMDPQFKWFEDEFGKRQLTGSGTVDPDGGNLTVTTQSQHLQIGDVILVAAQKWVFQVTAIVDADTVTVGAELGGATGAAADASGDVWLIGNANEEGAGLRTIKSTAIAELYNYCQIFRTPVGITESAKNTKGWTKENDFDFQRRKKAIEHMVDIERAFLFGKRGIITSGTHPKRFSAGILSRISTYATANVDTEAEFETWLESLFAHGNTEKYLLASATVVSLINGFAKAKLQVMSSEKAYGLRIVTYNSPHGTLHIVKHPLLTGTTYGNYAVGLDMETLTYRYLSNRDTKLLTNRQDNGEDSQVDEYLTECGLQMEQEQRHAIMSTGAL